MSLNAAFSLQSALYTYLRSADWSGVLGTPARIFDAIPDDAIFPLLTLGEGRQESVPGVAAARVHDIRIHVYSNYAGRREVKTLQDRIEALVHSRMVFSDAFRRVDQDLFHGVMRFRMVTEATA